MEYSFDSVTKQVENSESPCSALLDRLKALRKWQEEQRKELVLNPFGSAEKQVPFKNTAQESIGGDINSEEDSAAFVNLLPESCNQGCESIESNKKYHDKHSGLSPSPSASSSNMNNFRSSGDSGMCTDILSTGQSYESYHEVRSVDTLSTGQSYESYHEVRSVDTLSTGQSYESYHEVHSVDTSVVDSTKQDCQESQVLVPFQEGKQPTTLRSMENNGDFIYDQNSNRREDEIHLLYEKPPVTDLDLNGRDIASSRLRGLSNFIARHDDHLASKDLATTPEDGMNAIKDDVQEHPKPKFTFLRKGKGTSRFGMKAIVGLKPKSENAVSKNESKVRKEEVVKQLVLPEKKSLVSSNDYCSNESKVRKEDAFKQIDLSEKKSSVVTKKSTIGGHKNTFKMPIKSLQLHRTIPQDILGANKDQEINEYHLRKRELISASNSSQQVRLSPIPERDKHRSREFDELSAFEKLEELAEDSSFASNSSTVIQLLQRGLHSSSSTPTKSSSPAAYSTPLQSPKILLPKQLEQRGIPCGQIGMLEKPSPLLSVSQVLDQLKGIVRLEHLDLSCMTQKEMEMLLESYTDPENHQVESVVSFEKNIKDATDNVTSTPAVYQANLQSKPRVRFQPKGVEVLEYEPTDSEEENTLTDAPSIGDDTDLVTTSDLEVLSQVDVKNAMLLGNAIERNSKNCTKQDEGNMVLDDTPKASHHAPDLKLRQPMKLQFSPPCRPQNSASHYIWSIFRNEEPKCGNTKPKGDKLKSVSTNKITKPKISHLQEERTKNEEEPQLKETDNNKNQDTETYKALLMAKVCELEKEIEFYKKENSSTKNMQEIWKCEKDQLELKRREFQEDMQKEKMKLKEYIDGERNKLWKEKQLLKQQSPTVMSVKNESLEIVYLKEQLSDLREELQKKESLHQFAVKKLNDKIKMRDDEIKMLKEKNAALQKKEKENIQLKHELDRARLSKRPVQEKKQGVIPPGKRKMKQKTCTISSINRDLDKVSLDEPVVERRVPFKSLPPSSQSNLSKQVRYLNAAVHPKANKCSSENIDVDYGNECEKLDNLHPSGFERENAFNENDILEDKDMFNHLENQNNQLEHLQSNEYNNKPNEGTKLVNDANGHTSHITLNRVDIGQVAGNYLGSSENEINLEYTEVCRDDGIKELIYANGNKKEIHPDGSMILSYYNGDRKEVYVDRIVYVYGTDNTRHATFSDGKEVVEFPEGQKETRFPNGSMEIIFPDNSWKTVAPDGSEMTSSANGTIVRTNPDGIKVIEFVSGQREVHTPEQKRREYPDGTVKILYPDGTMETRYKSGRVRIKDKEGNLLSDSF